MLDFRQRLEQSRTTPVSAEPLKEPEDQYSCTYFATDKNPACLDLRSAKGSRKAFPYAYFTEMRYEPETGIELFTNSRKVTITGRNMTRLFDYLVRYRVQYVQEHQGNDGGDDGLFVEKISIEELI